MAATLRIGLFAAVLLASCASHPPVGGSCPRPRDPDGPPAVRTDGRLPETARPLAYSLAFTIDPAKERFTGTTTIEVAIPKPTAHFVLNARALHFTEARGRMLGETAWTKATTAPRKSHEGLVDEELIVSFPEVMVGNAELNFSFDAPFDDELLGIYKTKEGGRDYVLSEFEAVEARRAFPCFDEPVFKTPFQISVTVPNGLTALSNTAEVQRHTDGALTTFRFAKTPPLPTYLAAIAIGDFDIREGTPARGGKLPLRIATAKGKSELGTSALESARILVDGLEDYFGAPHPYPKLDLVAVPDFAAGAMENPGLITFREQILLLDPNNRSAEAERGQWLTVAHELAHQWFGNSVTTAWWDDLWLNEGFATWMEHRVLDTVKPSILSGKDAAADALGVMDVDSYPSARAVRQPVRSSAEAGEAFDEITYQKGAAVLRMLEQWIGPNEFRNAIRTYVSKYANTSVRAADFLNVLEASTGKPVSRVASGFIDQAGVPVLSFVLDCGAGSPILNVAQSTYRPLGVSAAGDQEWTVPVCVRHSNSATQECFMVDKRTTSLRLSGDTCPSWVHPNANGAGYYRFDLGLEWFRVVLHESELNIPEKMALMSSMFASVKRGGANHRAFLGMLGALADEDEDDRHLTELTARILREISHTYVTDETRVPFRRWVGKLFAPKKKRLGWGEQAKGESEDTVLHRRAVLYALADLGEDANTLAEAESLTKRWLLDPASISADAAAIAVDLASRKAPPTRIEEIRRALKNAKTPKDRVTAMRGLTGFNDPKTLEQALSVMLGDDVKRQDLRYTFDNAAHRERSSATTRAWTMAHWQELRAKFPGSLGSRFVSVASEACTSEQLEEAKTFLGPRLKEIEGAQRLFLEGVDRASACTAQRAAHPLRANDFL